MEGSETQDKCAAMESKVKRQRGFGEGEEGVGRYSPGSSPLTSLRVSSGWTLQTGLRARCRYSITTAAEEGWVRGEVPGTSEGGGAARGGALEGEGLGGGP